MAWTRKAGPLSGGDPLISDDAILADLYADPEEDGTFARTDRAVVNVTSTSTLREEDPTGIGPAVLMMFGVSYDAIAESIPGGFGDESNDTSAFADAAIQAAWAERYDRNVEVVKWQTFIRSSEADGTFWLRNRYETDPSSRYHPLHQVRVPMFRKGTYSLAGEECALVRVAYDLSTGKGTSIVDAAATDEGHFAIVYKDPFVVELPTDYGGGWLMILSRYRAEPVMGDSEEGPVETDEIPELKPETSIGDIVAFWSPDADFRSDTVVGPIRLMGATNCVRVGGVPSGDMVPEVRMWLGTAGAAVVTTAMSGDVEDALYLYYVAEGCTAFLSDVDEAGNPVLDADGVPLDLANPGQLSDFIADVLATREVTEGVWLTKIYLGELAWTLSLAALEDKTYQGEADWQDLSNASLRVNSEVQGLVRVWTVADWRMGYDDIRTEIYATKITLDTYTVFWADPSPVTEEDVLALFLAGIMPPAVVVETTDTGQAKLLPFLSVWSCVAVGKDYVRNGYGLDFTVRVPWSGVSDDRVVAATSFAGQYLDPDPCDPGDGTTFRVYVGDGTTPGATGPLGLYEISDRAEVFRPDWTSL